MILVFLICEKDIAFHLFKSFNISHCNVLYFWGGILEFFLMYIINQFKLFADTINSINSFFISFLVVYGWYIALQLILYTDLLPVTVLNWLLGLLLFCRIPQDFFYQSHLVICEQCLFFKKIIYFWLNWVLVATCGFSVVAKGGGYSLFHAFLDKLHLVKAIIIFLYIAGFPMPIFC